MLIQLVFHLKIVSPKSTISYLSSECTLLRISRIWQSRQSIPCIKRQLTLQCLTWCATWKELNDGLKNCEAPGLNRVPPEEFKAMEMDRQYVFDFLAQYFDGESNYESWHKSQCVPVPKSGDLSNPNKWQGVSVMDLQSKYLAVWCMMNVGYLTQLDQHGTKWQFGGTP